MPTTLPTRPEGPFSPQRSGLTVGLILTVVLIAFESLAVATVLPRVQEDLNGLALYGWAFSAFFMGYMLSTLILGGVADRYGPSRPFQVALVLFGAGLIVAGLAASMPVLILGRALQGLGGGGLVAVLYLAINRTYPDAQRARMLALLSSAWVLPALVGPYLAGTLADLASWRVVFLGIVPLLLISWALTRGALAGVTSAGTPLDMARVRWAFLAAIGVTLLLAALQQGTLLTAALVGTAGLACSVPALRALFPPLTWRAGGPLEAGYVTRFTLTFSFFGAEAFVPLGLTDVRHLTVTQAGLILTASALTWSTMSFLHSRFDERTRGAYRHVVTRVGVTLVIAASIATALVILSPGVPAWLVALTWALGGAGMGLAFQAHTLVVFRSAPNGQEGRVSGTLQMADVLGSATGAGIGGALVAAAGVEAGLAGVFALAVVAGALGWFVAVRLRVPAQEAVEVTPA